MPFDRELGAITIACEASDQPADAQLGVAYSLFNRVNDGRFEPTVAGVCMQRYQYSEYLPDKGDNVNLERVVNLPENDPAIISALAAYDAVADGTQPDPTDGSTHFFADAIAPPSWTVGATQAAKLGNILFWKNVK
ncbi:MAG: cell wall hydrolase [Patescibacteria group bacterium]|nr:cell wall hydrolase [Patescibacteria group bacterium]